MFNILPPNSYDRNFIETEKCRPFIDHLHEQLIQNIISKKDYDWSCIDDSYNNDVSLTAESTRPIYKKFKSLFQKHILSSTLNTITNLSTSARIDIILGCTQFIDNLHIKGPVQVLEMEYVYHTRLNCKLIPKTIGTLEPKVPLILSVPYSAIGKQHPQMIEILDRCYKLSIPVHLDGAWITAAKNIHFNFAHPAIASLGISMSKGYGTSGWNRIGLRWSKSTEEDSITLMNDYVQINAYSVVIGNYILENTEPDHLWNTHGDNHYKICNDFNLTSTDTIHMAKEGDSTRGISPLLRYLENL
jgi:hypothetical protein